MQIVFGIVGAVSEKRTSKGTPYLEIVIYSYDIQYEDGRRRPIFLRVWEPFMQVFENLQPKDIVQVPVDKIRERVVEINGRTTVFMNCNFVPFQLRKRRNSQNQNQNGQKGYGSNQQGYNQMGQQGGYNNPPQAPRGRYNPQTGYQQAGNRQYHNNPQRQQGYNRQYQQQPQQPYQQQNSYPTNSYPNGNAQNMPSQARQTAQPQQLRPQQPNHASAPAPQAPNSTQQAAHESFDIYNQIDEFLNSLEGNGNDYNEMAEFLNNLETPGPEDYYNETDKFTKGHENNLEPNKTENEGEGAEEDVVAYLNNL